MSGSFNSSRHVSIQGESRYVYLDYLLAFPALDNHVIIEINNMAAGRQFQGTKSRETLSQLIDRVGELSDALDAQAYSNNQIRSRREETPASARLSYL